ncbi:MAG TPA: hypothetical protein VIP77_04865 [Jiangellaceae bacterium]
MIQPLDQTITRGPHTIHITGRGRETCCIRIHDARTGDLVVERDHVDDADADMLVDRLVFELVHKPRYVVSSGPSWWYPASVFDTAHVRGQSPTRKRIPCASLRLAIEIADELNASRIVTA